MEEKILAIINTVLRNRNKKTLEKIEPQFDLRNDIGFDSLDLAELTVRIESEFDKDIFENGNIRSVEEIYNILK